MAKRLKLPAINTLPILWGLPMRFVCPSCFKDYDAPDTVGGCSFTCTSCQNPFVIPPANLATPNRPAQSQSPSTPRPLPAENLPALPPRVAQWDERDGEEDEEVEEREDPASEKVRQRWRQRRNRRAMWSLFLKVAVVAALGVGATLMVLHVRERTREIETQNQRHRR